MHIVQFVHRYPPAVGGAEAYTHRLVESLRDCGDTVDVWTTTALELEELWHPRRRKFEADGVRRYQPLSFPLRRYLLKALTFLPSSQLRSFVLPCNPICPAMWRDARTYDGPLDAVHATAFPYAWPILCARRLARRRGVPFLLTPFLHLTDARTRRQYTQPALRWLLLDADVVFVQTRLERDAALTVGVRPERLVLHGLGVDFREVQGGDRVAFRARHGIGRDEVVVGHLANLSFEKGSVDLLKAVQRLLHNNVNCRLVLAGHDMPNFRSEFQKSPCRNSVILTGPLSESEKRDFYAGIDVFALPSRSDSFGLVLLEAWANGKPCVAYRAGGPGEIIHHGKDGLLADCGNWNELARCLQSLIGDEPLRRQFGVAGQRRTQRDFGWNERLGIVHRAMHTSARRQAMTHPHPLGSRPAFKAVAIKSRSNS